MAIANTELEFFKNEFKQVINEHQLQTAKEKLEIGLSAANDGDNVDEFNRERDRQMAFKLNKRNEFYVGKIKQALKRIEDNSFGECFDCGNEIELPRLKARPTASLCITCKEEQELDERHILYETKTKTSEQDHVKHDLDIKEEMGADKIQNLLKTASRISNQAASGY